MSENNSINEENEVKCQFCNGFYGPTSGGPVCSVCHMFIFEYNCQASGKTRIEDKDTSDDSGNEDGEYKNASFDVASENSAMVPYHCILGQNVPQVACQAVSSYRATSRMDYIPSGTANHFQYIPAEILILIVDYLDDMDLYSLKKTSNRFMELIDHHVTEEQWQNFVEYRWPMHRNNVPNVCYRQLYMNLMESMTCQTCLEQIREPSNLPSKSTDTYFYVNRLKIESDILQQEEVNGISATCLDPYKKSTWVASIMGPPGSCYEGGIFYLQVRIPGDFPLQAPRVQFLTRVCHPNISKHGEIGLDLLQCSWSLALTVSKLLISIQSLLTDPNGTVCMEADIGELYNNNPAEFKRLSRLWTWKYAMHDYLPPELIQSIKI